MDFSLNEEQRKYQGIARAFAKEELAPVALEMEKIPDWEARMPWALTERASALGLRQLPYPREYGGAGADVLTLCLVGEELAAGDLGFAVNLDQTWKLSHILEKVAPGLRELWLRRLCEDPRFLVAIAMSEPGAGSDHQGLYDDPSIALYTKAEKKGGQWVINGRKHFISNGPVASLYVVAARTDMTKNLREGLSGFLVPRDRPGFSIGRVHDKMGQRLSMNAELIFDNVEVPENHLILGEGDMFEIRGNLLAMGKPEAAATVLGVGRAALESALEFSRERMRDGGAGGQGVEMVLADMALGLEAARTLIWRSAWSVDHQKPYDFTLGWKCKILASEAALECARRGLEIVGGAGTEREKMMEKYLRDAASFLHSDGTNQVLRLRAARAYLDGRASVF
ncbi:MAG: acyl-CoA dehydrogenase family protein [bacterium]|nr:acyl-CoA dehydrogenase family protein [bacterium]